MSENLLQLVKKAQRLGLNFDIGRAYISREYIDQQTALNVEINAFFEEGHYIARINHLEDVLRALLDDDNEATRADAQRALECS
jgi:hypothetical protein